ncbi:MAG: FAD-dependent thymidylate synthase [bacterium]|nr:FAD-dependent thymidylate synthase [bacterium]
MNHQDLERYAPDLAPEEWSERDRRYLEPFATNLDGPVTVIHNLPPEIVGALCSRASRASKSLLRVFLDEYVYPIADGEDPKLAAELDLVVDFLREHGFKNILNNARAQKLYATWYAQYGDDSIGQVTGAHVVTRLSQVAMKEAEDQRIALEPIEQSTRFVRLDQKVRGRYLYYVPWPDLERLGLLGEYTAAMDMLFDTYAALIPELTAWFAEKYPEEKPTVIEKKALDTLRGLLPMATQGQVAFRGNGQAYEYLIARNSHHELGELRWFAGALRAELDREIPSLLLRLDKEESMHYQRELAGRRGRMRAIVRRFEADGTIPQFSNDSNFTVKLLECDSHAEEKIVAAALWNESHASWSALQDAARAMTPEERLEVVRAYVGDRQARWQKVGRALENAELFFEITMNIGAYRDLHRHRMHTQERQPFSMHHRYDLPVELVDAGLDGRFVAALDSDRLSALFERLEDENPLLAQYVVPLAYRVRFYQRQNLRQFFWETELRTIPEGHPDYRAVEQEKVRLVLAKLPAIGEFLKANMQQYVFARRGQDERIADKEKRVVEGLSGEGKK